jgi:hypothetical protein
LRLLSRLAFDEKEAEPAVQIGEVMKELRGKCDLCGHETCASRLQLDLVSGGLNELRCRDSMKCHTRRVEAEILRRRGVAKSHDRFQRAVQEIRALNTGVGGSGDG